MLAAGSRLGPYEIVAPLGTGGMGEVYRARDPRLRRDVAIKVSAEQFTDRFEREARAIAALNHPHICTLHDVGPNYLVMELIEGPTLAERMRQGPVPLEEALRIAKQIADALDAAHTRGIVHRDLKPANVKLTSDDVVKVLDFGLAKHDESGPADGDPDLSPTMNPATRVGMILGTAAYMAPEQARGRTVDKRADIWAFGVVLYELVSGRRLFQRDTASDTIASVLTFEPEWDAVPGRLRPLLRRCLAKDPRQRLRDIGDLPLLLDAAPPMPPRRPWLAWTVAAAAALVALAVVGAVHLRERTPAAQPIKFQIPTTIALSPSGNIGLSPDGRQLAFLGNGPDGVIRMWVRDIDSVDIRPLAGSETASYGPPFFWSPDGRYIAYDAGGQLKRVSLAGELAQTVCPLTAAAIGGSWNKRGDIILGNVLGGLLRVSERGGAPAPVTTLDASRKEAGHLLPTFLPDGTHFIYLRVSRASPEMSGVFVGSLDAKPEAQDMRRLMPYEPGLAYAPPRSGHIGHLLFVHEGTLIAQPFDDRRLQLTGDPMALAQSVGVYLDTAFFSTSQNGTLVYRSGDPSFPITWRDRRGNVAAQVMDAGQYSSASMSADGARGVVSITSPRNRANADLWLIDLAEGRNPSRFTFDPDGRADFPIWSPDGRQIVYRSGGAGRLQLRLKRVGSSPTEFDTLSPIGRIGMVTPTSFSPDGRFLLFSDALVTPGANSGFDLSLLRMDHGSPPEFKPIPFAQSRFDEEDGRFSPDGRWIAFVSNESGAREIYVRGFNGDAAGDPTTAGVSTLVSKGGGRSPRWRRDGKELFYLGADGKLMTVDVAAGAEFRVSKPTPLFQAPPGAIFADASPDGQRFLILQDGAAPFTVVMNWAKN